MRPRDTPASPTRANARASRPTVDQPAVVTASSGSDLLADLEVVPSLRDDAISLPCAPALGGHAAGQCGLLDVAPCLALPDES